MSFSEKIKQIEFTSLVIEDIISTCMYHHEPFGDLPVKESLKIAKQIQKKAISKAVTRIRNEGANEDNFTYYLTEDEQQIDLNKFLDELRWQNGQPRILNKAEMDEFLDEVSMEEFWNLSYLYCTDTKTLHVFSQREDSHLNAADLLTLIAIRDPEKVLGWTKLPQYYTKLRAALSNVETHFLPTVYLREKDMVHFLRRHKQFFPEKGEFMDGVKHCELMHHQGPRNVDNLLQWLALQQWDMYFSYLRWNLDSYPTRFLEIVKWTSEGITYNIRT